MMCGFLDCVIPAIHHHWVTCKLCLPEMLPPCCLLLGHMCILAPSYQWRAYNRVSSFPPVASHSVVNMLCWVHRCLQGQVPQYLRSKFSTNAVSGYNGTRGKNKLHLQRPLTDNYRRTFEFQGAPLSYNKLLQSITLIL